MDDRNLNMDLDELFRKKLESSELIPGEMVRKNLMQKLGRQEFVRFNPARFNVYYLGGIVAASVIATLLFTSGPENKKDIKIIPPKEELITPDKPAGNIINNEVQSTVAGETKQVAVKSEQGKPELKSDNKHNQISTLNLEDATTVIKTKVSDDSLQKVSALKEKLIENVREVPVQKKPYAEFNISLSSGCIPLKVKFINRSESFDSCVWSFGDGGYSRSMDTEWIFDTEGEYKVTLRVFGADGTESVSTEIITVHPKPVARFETSPEKPVLPDDAISFINYSRDAVKYRWDFGDGRSSDAIEPEHRYGRYSNYNVRLIAWSQYGCSDTLMVKNAFSVSGCYIDFPNAFIPNPDGPAGGYYSSKSDEAARIFHPVTSGVSDYQLRIFSKTGVIIFESNDINIGWDGYNKGKLCEPGVYVWKVRGTYKNGEPFVKMGDVTIIRN